MSSRSRTPLTCPICGGALVHTQVRRLGNVTAALNWELHAGRCEEHGWFQAEMISTPPREVFPVKQPGGIARKITINGQAVYAFPTVWDSTGGRREMDSYAITEVDAYDPDLWAIDWSRLPGGVEDVVLSSA